MLIFIICILKLVQIGIEMIPKKMAASCLLHRSLIHYEIFSTFCTLKYTFCGIFGCRKKLEVHIKTTLNLVQIRIEIRNKMTASCL